MSDHDNAFKDIMLNIQGANGDLIQSEMVADIVPYIIGWVHEWECERSGHDHPPPKTHQEFVEVGSRMIATWLIWQAKWQQKEESEFVSDILDGYHSIKQ
jgi:hypothetical protein